MKSKLTSLPISVTLTCENEADALRLWAILSLSWEDVRTIIKSHANTEAYLKYTTGMPGTLYPLWNELDDLLLARGIL